MRCLEKIRFASVAHILWFIFSAALFAVLPNRSLALTMGYASIFLMTQCQRCAVAHTRCTDWQIYSSRICKPTGLHHLASTFIQIHEREHARPSFCWLNFRPFRSTAQYRSVYSVRWVSARDAMQIHFSFSKRISTFNKGIVRDRLINICAFLIVNCEIWFDSKKRV